MFVAADWDDKVCESKASMPSLNLSMIVTVWFHT